MKKTIYLLFVIIVVISLSINCNDNKKTKVKEEKKESAETVKQVKTPVKASPVKIDFKKEPVKFMGQIFKSYHDWDLKRGITLSEEAIAIIDVIYNKDPNQIINDPTLKLNKAFQIKSTLHTLKGMLYFRTSLHSKKDPVRTENQAIMDKLKKGKEVTDKDFEDLTNKIEKNTSSIKKIDVFGLAKNEFLIAIKTDSNNPSPHYQLAEILKNSLDNATKLKAEEHFFESAKLSIQEGDSKSINKILDALKDLNPKSIYITKIESMNKGVKNGVH